ncbi:MAG: hypothetical protein Q4F66_02525 [Clostridium sp.]|nr:hypothetical protein [Clostridium sp.]
MYTQKDKDNFFSAVDSLKKYRRAELFDEKGNSILDELYVDLLPNDQIIKTCLLDNTTFLIGRKGTGKSTIFLKLQDELKKRNDNITCYIDTKTIFENSQSEFIDIEYLKDIIPTHILKKYLIERTFIQSILIEIQKELNCNSPKILDKIKKVIGIDKSVKVKEKIKKLQDQIENNNILKQIELPVINQVLVDSKQSGEHGDENSLKLNYEGKVSNTSSELKSGVEYGEKYSEKYVSELQNNFKEIFLKVFQIKDIILKIKDILHMLNVRKLIILLDDFSEIEDTSIKTFTDVILTPLNNWSDDFIKFKIAAYPNRIPFGKIELGKVDIIDLDFYNLYSEFDRDTMEEKAIDFTKRLIEKRFNHYVKKTPQCFFDVNQKDTIESYYELLFQISMNVPRIIGYVLFYCYNSSIVFDKPITRSALESAAQKYYTKVIEPFFSSTTYSMMAFEEKISTLQFKELLELLVDNAKNIKKRIITGELTGTSYNKTSPHTSHFYFMTVYEKFIKTLELNFFITKYNELSDRDGVKVSIYALNYGLCIEKNIRWGGPKGQRKYFIERPFNCNKIIDNFLNESKQIICLSCDKTYSIKQLPLFEFNKMHCPECNGTVKVVPISDSIEKEIRQIDQSKLLHPVEYSILHELNKSDNPLRAKEIAEELDCSYQLIAVKAKTLDTEKKLLIRSSDTNGNRVYKLTEKAYNTYFS